MPEPCSRCSQAGEAPPAHRIPFPPEVKEKVLAAHRAGVTDVILPKANAGDVDDVPQQGK